MYFGNDRTIEASERVWIRYALETNDAFGLAELVRRADAGEPIIDDSQLLEEKEELSTEEKLERLADLIFRAGDHPETKSAALLILMSHDWQALSARLSFPASMVDAQIGAIESELLVT